MKKVLAFLLCIACVFALFSATAYAETGIDLDKLDDEQIVELSNEVKRELLLRGLQENERRIVLKDGGFTFPKDITDEELSQLSYLISAILATHNKAAPTAPSSSEKVETEPIQREAGEEYDVVVTDCAFAWESGKVVRIKPRVHNCTNKDASYLQVNCELIDKNGKTIRVASCDTGGVAAGANEWVSGTISISKDELSKLAELRFNGGGFNCNGFRQVVTFAETTFTKDYVFGE